MAFKNRNLSVIAYANGFTLWHYVSDDTIEEIKTVDYFKPVVTLAAFGDIFIINASDETDILYIKNLEPMELDRIGNK